MSNIFENAELVREVTFTPYAPGQGPAFKLELYSGDFGRFPTGQERMGYRLTQIDAGPGCGLGLPCGPQCERRHMPLVLFEATDFGRAPGNTEDGNATVESIMSFLTLRPGDTDEDYFKDYTPEQLAFAEQHAETLQCEVQALYCDENGNVRE
jgi:hypothetical protein